MTLTRGAFIGVDRLNAGEMPTQAETSASPWSGRRLRVALVLLAALAALVASARAAASAPVPLGVDLAHLRRPVPRTFLGLSFEASSLAHVSRFGRLGDMVALLRSLGPGVLRFGGVSADSQVAWSDPQTPRPAWASAAIGVHDLGELAQLARRSGWRVLLTIGMGHLEPAAAAREAAAARATLGPWLEAIELGNEPNAYALHGLREEPWTSGQYEEQVSSYRAAIGAAAPGLALAGPDVSGSAAFGDWGSEELVTQWPSLLTGHHYPLGCHQQPPPSIERLLSVPVREGEEVSMRRYLHLAQENETPFRLDETNTVSCGGVAGISDTFAAALWAVDYVARAMSMGAAGINLEGNPANCRSYTPLCARDPAGLAAGELAAQPEWYALLLTSALVGDRPLGRPRQLPGHPNVDASLFLAPDGALRCVLVDEDPPGSPSVAVELHAGPRFAAARLLALTAPSPQATSGVALGGRAVAGEGSWHAPARLPVLPSRHGRVRVVLAASSAALVTLPARR
jgi:hypothetical protein